MDHLRILIEVHHPAHVHFFKNPIRIWKEHGHQVLVAGRDRGIMEKLLKAYPWIEYEIISKMGKQNRFPLQEFIRRQIGMFRLIRKFRPNVVVSLMGSYAQTAWLFGIPNVIFTDSEHQSVNHLIAHPFATKIYTPSCFWKNLGKKQIRYAGYHELSFLNQKYFKPDPEVLKRVGDVNAKSYVIVRLCAWDTLHDIGKNGMQKDELIKFIGTVSKRFRVFVVPEGNIPAELEPYRFRVEPHLFHDFLAFARLIVSEGASTASEAACLGIPAVYINPIDAGTLDEQEKRYGMIYKYTSPEPGLKKALELLEKGDLDELFISKRDRLLDEKINVTDFVVSEIEKIGNE